MLSNKLAAKIRESVPRPAPSVIEVIEDMGALAPAPLISGANAPDNSTRDSAGAGPQTELLTPRTTGAKRPDVLRGMESVHIWLRSEAKSILDAKHGEKTLAQYERNGTRLNLARPQGKPIISLPTRIPHRPTTLIALLFATMQRSTARKRYAIMIAP